MQLCQLERLDAEISQLNERCALARKGQGWSVVLLLAYGMLVSLGQFKFNGMLFGLILVVALGSFIWVHLMTREISKKLRECEGYL